MSISKLLDDLEKKFGKGSAIILSDDSKQDVEVISTGCISLDTALGVGGIPKGRITEIYGAEGTGKTTVSLQAVANAQKTGVVAYVDTENALDLEYAQALGVDLGNLILSQPSSADEALDIVRVLAESGECSLIVVDSVAALTPQAELNGDIGDTHVGLLARLMSQAMRILNPIIHKNNVAVIFINQTREKIGVMFGSNKTTPGGKALKFYASIRMETIRIGQVKKGEEVIGNKTKVSIVKNKVAAPFKQCEFELIYGEGTAKENEIIDLAVAKGIIEKGGAWFTYKGEKFQGKDKFREYLKNNKDIMKELEDEYFDSRAISASK